MPRYDRFMIAPISTGLETDQKPWMIPDDAFARLEDCYLFRGRIRKRFGTRYLNSQADQSIANLFSRARISLTTVTSGAASGTVPGTVFKVGQQLSVGSNIFTVSQTGTPAAMLKTGTATTATFNTSTGAFSFTGLTSIDTTPVYWYPGTPICGIMYYQTASSENDPTVFFDTQFAYTFSNSTGGLEILGPVPPASGSGIWSAPDNQLFWGITWQGGTPDIRYLFVTNNKAADGIQYWNGTIWQTLAPQVDDVADTLQTALMLVVFKNYLIAFSPTISAGGGTTYTNMAMWAAFGDPTAMNAWRSDLPGQGNNLVAPTMEDIVSCEFVKDRLIVFFERSTYEFAFTGNYAFPFSWQKINTELGTESTFSAVPFDQFALAVGNVGIHACNGQNVQRIDNKIPYSVWDIRTGSTQIDRVYGIRDFYAEQVYWTFPGEEDNIYSNTYPNQILAYNYATGSWALFNDSITAFGYFYLGAQSVINWNSTDVTWDNDQITWDSGTVQALNQSIVAGNQAGFVFICDIEDNDQSANLSITNVTPGVGPSIIVTLNIMKHNLNYSDYIYLQNLNGFTPVSPYTEFAGIYPITQILDSDTVQILAPDIFASLFVGQEYTGGGTVARVPSIDILTKQFNFYIKDDRNAAVARIDFLVDRTDSSEITIDALTSTSPQGLLSGSQDTGAILGNSILSTAPYDATLYPYEQKQDRLWHPVYFNAEGNAIQFRFYLSNTQLSKLNVWAQDLQIHAFTIFTTPTSSRAQ